MDKAQLISNLIGIKCVFLWSTAASDAFASDPEKAKGYSVVLNSKRIYNIGESMPLIFEDKNALEALRKQCQTTYRRSFLNLLYEMVSEYTERTNQKPLFTCQPWFYFIDRLRAVSAHHISTGSIRWPKALTAAGINELNWRNRAIKKDSSGNDVRLSPLELVELWEDVYSFVERDLV